MSADKRQAVLDALNAAALEVYTEERNQLTAVSDMEFDEAVTEVAHDLGEPLESALLTAAGIELPADTRAKAKEKSRIKKLGQAKKK